MAKVKLNLAGFRAVRQSAPIQHAIDQQAALIAGSEGNVKAMEDNAKHNTLLKAVKRR